jgi:hypothetical protein
MKLGAFEAPLPDLFSAVLIQFLSTFSAIQSIDLLLFVLRHEHQMKRLLVDKHSTLVMAVGMVSAATSVLAVSTLVS